MIKKIQRIYSKDCPANRALGYGHFCCQLQQGKTKQRKIFKTMLLQQKHNGLKRKNKNLQKLLLQQVTIEAEVVRGENEEEEETKVHFFQVLFFLNIK